MSNEIVEMTGTVSQPSRCPAGDGAPTSVVPSAAARADHTLTTYADVLQAFRSPVLSTVIHDGSERFRAGTVLRIEDPEHALRRKTMGRLLRGDGDEWFRERILFPTIRRNLEAVLSNKSAEQPARMDVAVFARQAFFQLAAALIGLHQVDDAQKADELRVFFEPINIAMRAWFLTGDRDAMMRRGVAVKEEFRERYYEPAYQHHLELVRAVQAGELSQEELPHDLLTLIVTDAEPAWNEDPDLPVREAMTDMLNAGTLTPSITLVHTLHECFCWFQQHPEDAHKRTDPEFLYRAVAESLRLHPAVPAFFRTALDNVTLGSGREISRGETVALIPTLANLDPGVFGADAGQFNPHREVPKGVYPYGVAFGTGRHMCFGLPIILGSGGTNGSHARILRAFFEAGIQPDPKAPPRLKEDSELPVWESYPVIFDTAD